MDRGEALVVLIVCACIATVIWAGVSIDEAQKADAKAERACVDAGFQGGYMTEDGPRCRNEYPLPEKK